MTTSLVTGATRGGLRLRLFKVAPRSPTSRETVLTLNWKHTWATLTHEVVHGHGHKPVART